MIPDGYKRIRFNFDCAMNIPVKASNTEIVASVNAELRKIINDEGVTLTQVTRDAEDKCLDVKFSFGAV